MAVLRWLVFSEFLSLAVACSIFVCADPDQEKYCACLGAEMAKCSDSVADTVARESLEAAWKVIKCVSSSFGFNAMKSLPLLVITAVGSLLLSR